MGIIIKQSIKGTFWSYVGVIIGFVTTGLLFPRYLTTEVIGLFSLLVSFSTIFAQFSSLGVNGITSRLFPYFRNNENNHNGYLFITTIVILIGFSLIMLFFALFYPYFVASNIEKSYLLSEYAYLIIPMTFFVLIFNYLDTYNKLLYDAVLGTFLQEFLQRVLILISLILFILKVINLQTFIILYSASVCAKAVVIFIYLLIKGNISFKPNLKFISPELRREMISVALFSVLTGLGSSLVFQFDKIIVNDILGLKLTGIYTIGFFFGSLVVIPSRTLLRISGTLIADEWKNENVDKIESIYKKTCITQFIIALYIFGGIWLNISNIIEVLGNEYLAAKWVIFFISLGYVVHMGTGANDQIITYSKHYRVSLWFNLIMIVTIIALMYLIIPIWGITGAAIAVCITFIINNLLRFLFLQIKYKMQPFNINFIYAILILVLAFIGTNYLPQLPLIADILVRSTIYTVVFWIFILATKTSKDINETVFAVWDKVRTMMKKN
ncbi:MAG: oligosaccharide flippase family protein [Lentimicrobiaceae bacterium]|nr:oligosaccharide flippase family protein [Lentimicrobiaceae bacterium]